MAKGTTAINVAELGFQNKAEYEEYRAYYDRLEMPIECPDEDLKTMVDRLEAKKTADIEAAAPEAASLLAGQSHKILNGLSNQVLKDLIAVGKEDWAKVVCSNIVPPEGEHEFAPVQFSYSLLDNPKGKDPRFPRPAYRIKVGGEQGVAEIGLSLSVVWTKSRPTNE